MDTSATENQIHQTRPYGYLSDAISILCEYCATDESHIGDIQTSLTSLGKHVYDSLYLSRNRPNIEKRWVQQSSTCKIAIADIHNLLDSYFEFSYILKNILKNTSQISIPVSLKPVQLNFLRKMKSSQRLSLTERAYREIRRRITKHIIKPGSLMTTKELAALLNMSQTPIREALCILEHEHFVVRMPKRGYAVRVMDVNEFIDIYDMRLAIEVLAVKLATQKIKNAEIVRLEKLLDDTGKDNPKFNIMEAEQEFHSIILESTDNSLLEQTGKRILDRIWIFQKIVLYSSEHWSESNCDHIKLYNEIKSGHWKKASEIMERHLNWGRQLVLSRLEDGDDFLGTLFYQS